MCLTRSWDKFSIANSKHFKLFHSCQHANCTLYPVPFFKNTPRPIKLSYTEVAWRLIFCSWHMLLFSSHSQIYNSEPLRSFCVLEFRFLKALWPACCLQCELLWHQQLLQAPHAPNDIHKHTHRHPWLLLKSLLFLLICFLMWCFKRLKN